MTEKECYLAFSHCLGIGPVKFKQLVNHFGGVREAYGAAEGELKELLGIKIAEKLVIFRNEFIARDKLKEFEEKEIAVLTQKDLQYPKQLLDLEDAPICIYVKGDLGAFDFAKDNLIAVVGTRTPTSYGSSMARKFAAELGSLGFVIVSGMALGIDAEAHRGALDSRSKTIAVLGCGVDIPHPSTNKPLYEEILKNGIVMSEFPPGMKVQRGLFISRNRIISGLSKGVLVVEGAHDSGALITARNAGEQGKEVFAIPAPITSSMSEAPNFLLKQGAKLVTSVNDILEEFNLAIAPAQQHKTLARLSLQEEKIYDLLLKEPHTLDQLIESLDFSISEIMKIATGLELKGVVRKTPDGKYVLK